MKNANVVCAIMIVLLTFGLFKPEAKTYELNVQADKIVQEWNRYYEKGVATCHQYTLVNSYWNRNIINALKFGHDSCGFQYWRGHGILHDDVGLVKAATENSLTLNWKNFDMVYDSGMATGMYPVCEISTTPKALAKNPSQTISASYNNLSPLASPPTKYGWGQWEALMDSIVRHVEERYGAEKVRKNWYFEVWNEPNWWYSSFPEYLELYAHTAAAIKRADPELRVGGPACQGNMTFNKPNDHIAQLLKYCNDKNNPLTGEKGVPIDLITWHVYSDNPLTIDGINGFLLNPNTAVSVHRMILDNLKKDFPWFKGPSMNNETGPSSRTPVQRDTHQSASWLVRTIHLMNEGGAEYPPPFMFGYWSLSDIYEEGMNNVNNLTFQQGNYGMLLRGTLSYRPSWDIPKPVFQAYRMLHKLGNHELATSGAIPNKPYSIDDGVGIIATASKEGTGNDSIQIMVYNHIASDRQNSSPKDSITLSVANIPWTSGKVKVQHLVLDTTRSNTYTKWMSIGKPAKPTNQQWDQLRAASDLEHYTPEEIHPMTDNSFSMAFSAHYFSVHLVTLTNPDAVATEKPVKESVVVMKEALKAFLDGQNLMLQLSAEDDYSVTLYTSCGQKLYQTAVVGSGNFCIMLPKLPAGTFVMECKGKKGTLVKQFVHAR